MNALSITVGNRTHTVAAQLPAPFYVLDMDPFNPDVVPALLAYSDVTAARSYAQMRGCVVLDERFEFVR